MRKVIKCLGVAFVLLFASVASAQQIRPSPEIIVGEVTTTPVGWNRFCVDYKSECDVQPMEDRKVVLDAKVWRNLQAVNTMVNRQIKPKPDLEHWGTSLKPYVYRGLVEKWDFAEDGYGDCDEYVLVKRRELLRQGWPRSSLLVTVVKRPDGEIHAVLTVRTTHGDLVLDNMANEIKGWWQTPYDYIKRQSAEDPNKWLALRKPGVMSVRQ